MTAKHFQALINQAKEVLSDEIGIIDDNGIVLASTNSSVIAKKAEDFDAVIESGSNQIIIKGRLYIKHVNKGKIELITYIHSTNENSAKLLAMFSVSALSLKQIYDEKHDKYNFIKNILLDNVLPGDVPVRARELYITNNAARVVYVVKSEKTYETGIFDTLFSLFPNKNKDFVVTMDEEIMVVVKELRGTDEYKEINKIAQSILTALNGIGDMNAKIGVGTIVQRIKEIGSSYREAQLAMHIGGIFDTGKMVQNYNNLGIGRLIYQLPKTLCRLFLKEVFKESYFEIYDDEIGLTVDKFFENNLNVSETSRQLFIHRNTLVYRLDKIQRITGLDLRMFDDAIIFKVAMLVKKYLDTSESSVY